MQADSHLNGNSDGRVHANTRRYDAWTWGDASIIVRDRGNRETHGGASHTVTARPAK